MLPESLQEIAEIIGIGPAIKLSIDFGGTEEYIPKKMSKNHKISISIGFEAATELAHWAGGGRLDIPRAVAVHKGKRNKEIYADLKTGHSKKYLARKHNLTTRRIRQIANDTFNKNVNQIGLFDSDSE
ncbi:MAG: hypothetical protein JKX94_05835 [Sneathiella sp.]|nr:hypothetical protein [Sneathiella sp.]